MQIKLAKDETDILALIGDRDADLRAKVQEIAKEGRRLGRKIQRLERERAGLRNRLLSAVRRNRPDMTIPDNATPSADGHGSAYLAWPDPTPDKKIPEKPATLDAAASVETPAASPVIPATAPLKLADIVDPDALRRACGDPPSATPAEPASTNGACAHG